MKEIQIKKHIKYLFGIAFFVFLLNKFYLRSWILENETPELIQVFCYSVPNFLEAIIGTLIVTGILLQARQYFNKNLGSIKDIFVHILAVGIVAIYVLSQELKYHNLGGNNIYDPYDLVASLLGLIMAFAVIQWLGFTEETKLEVSNVA